VASCPPPQKKKKKNPGSAPDDNDKDQKDNNDVGTVKIIIDLLDLGSAFRIQILGLLNTDPMRIRI